MDILAEARKRTLEHAESGENTERKPDYTRQMKYASTPKGKATNSRKCRTYRSKNRDKLIAYNRKWMEEFERTHGVKYGTYRYRRKHGLAMPEEKNVYSYKEVEI